MTRVLRGHARIRLAIILSAAAALLSACGAGTAAVASSGGSSSSSQDAAPVGSDLTVGNAAGTGRAASSPATVRFRVTDPDSGNAGVALAFATSIAPQDFRPITLAAGSSPLRSVPADGTSIAVLWDFAADLGSASFRNDVVLRLEVLGGKSPGQLGVELGNDPPAIPVAPAALVAAGEVSGNVDVAFSLRDSSRDIVDVEVEFDIVGDQPDTGWRRARSAAISGDAPTPQFALSGLETTGGVDAFTFRWESDFGGNASEGPQLRGKEVDAVLRLTPRDRLESDVGAAIGQGAAAFTIPFRVDNNRPPIAFVDSGAIVTSPDERRGIAVPFRVVDDEGDDVEVIFQWRRQGEAFPALPTETAALDAILADPVQRRLRHVCSPYPNFARGLAVAIDATSVRLPELGAGQSWILASGIVGRSLEFLRPSQIPQPIALAWSSNPLAGPVGALPLDDGRTALVLDAGPVFGAWRLREIDLATGAVVRDIATSNAGAPSALAIEHSGRFALVATAVGTLWRLERVDLSSGAVFELFTSTPSLPLAPVRGLVSRDPNTALVTAGGSLLRVDLRDPLAPLATTLISGMSAPRGIALDPLDDSVFVAERNVSTTSGVGRILVIDLANLAQLPLAIGSGGTAVFDRPESIAFERDGTRLLVVVQNPGSGRRLVALDLGATPSVPAAIGSAITADVASLACGPDGLRILALPVANDLVVGGGVEQRRTMLSYQPAGQRVVVDSAFAPAVRQAQPWRISDNRPVRGSAQGTAASFTWDSSDVLGGLVLLRAIPRDAEIGLAADSAVSKLVRAPWDHTPVVLSPPNSPSSLAVGDLDRDGDIDLVTANGFSNTVAVFFQTTPKVFNPTPLLLGNPTITLDPSDVEVADLDRDGDADIVSANAMADNLAVFKQATSGNFNAPIPVGGIPGPAFSPTKGPKSVAVADLDADSDLDLVSANSLSDNLDVFVQSPSGVFGSNPLSIGGSPTLDNPQSVAAADLDLDGDIDLVCANQDSGNLTVFLQNGPGTFDPALSLGSSETTAMANDVIAADFDSDGDLDLACGNDRGLAVFIQGTPGDFDPDPLLLGSDRTSSVATADVDRDGDLDVVVSTSTVGNSNLVFVQDAPGSFDPTPLVLGSFPDNQSSSIAVADIDRDGGVDIVSEVTGSVGVFFHDSRGSFGSSPIPKVLPSGSRANVAADFDRDGDIDLASAGVDSEIFFQESPGNFASTSLAFSTFPVAFGVHSVIAADLDADGDSDLASANFSSDNLAVFIQESPGVFDTSPLTLGGSQTTNFAFDVAAADLDRDGDLDLVAASVFSNSLAIFFQGLPGTFAPTPLSISSLPAMDAPISVASADLDRDGDFDLVSANDVSSNLTIFFQGSSPGTFGTSPVVLGGPAITKNAASVEVADLDSDGDADLVCANGSTLSDGNPGDNLTIFFQGSPGTFGTTPLTLGGGAQTNDPMSVAAADFDLDGDLDLVSANSQGNNLTVFFQSSSGSFGPTPLSLTSPTVITPVFVTAADLDRDGDFDIVSSCSSSLTAFLQSAPGAFAAAPFSVDDLATSRNFGSAGADIDPNETTSDPDVPSTSGRR